MVNEDELLTQALGDVGAVLGGRCATERAVRRMRKDVYETNLDITVPAEVAFNRTKEILERGGQLVEVHREPENGLLQVVGIIGTGIGKLNPAVVTITVIDTVSGARIEVRGVAKEGIIRQRGGRFAAEKIINEVK
jgi:hypothetical protein